MNNDAFTAGVVPGGLISRSEIKILICYLMRSLSSPVSHDDLVGALTEQGLANYFELNSAISELAQAGHIASQGDSYLLKSTGWQIADMLSADLPTSVKERALEAVKEAIDLARRRRQNKVEITQADNGFMVRGSVTDDAAGLLYSICVYAPTREAAQTMRDNFVDKAEELLRHDLALLTGETL